MPKYDEEFTGAMALALELEELGLREWADLVRDLCTFVRNMADCIVAEAGT